MIYDKSIELADLINAMSVNFDEMHLKNKELKILSQAKLFKKLSSLMLGQALAVRNTGNLLKLYTGNALKFYLQENEPLYDLLSNLQK